MALRTDISPSFGIILSGSSGRQFILNTTDTVTGTDSGDYISGAVAGEINVHKVGQPLSINILIDNISTSGGLAVNQGLCAYDGGAQLACGGAGISGTTGPNRTLKVGLDITTNSAHVGDDTASVDFDVNVTII